MKTSLVVKTWNNTFARAAMPGEAPEEYHSTLIHSPAHKAMMSRGFGKAKPVHQPEAVYIRSNGFRPKGGKLERVRKLDEDMIETLEVFDAAREKLRAQISELNKKERELLAEVYEESVPLKMTEVRGFRDIAASR